MKEKQWENLCKKCGKCCHYKHKFGDYIIYDPELVCKYLNDDNTCSVYDTRQKVAGCMLLRDAILQKDLLPASCGYIHINPDHIAFTEPKDMPSFWMLVLVIESHYKKTFPTDFKNIDLAYEVYQTRLKAKNFKIRKNPAV
jgi:hypothetical protein